MCYSAYPVNKHLNNKIEQYGLWNDCTACDSGNYVPIKNFK